MGIIGSGVFLIGLLAFSIGLLFFLLGVKSRGEVDTEWGRFSGPVWFILVALGIILMAAGWMLPI